MILEEEEREAEVGLGDVPVVNLELHRETNVPQLRVLEAHSSLLPGNASSRRSWLS